MDVTRANFYEVLTELEEEIDSALFLSVDGEFTGLQTDPRPSAYDTPKQYYQKLRSGAMDYLLVQFGLCTFKFDKKTNRYTHKAYNFYIFPSNECSCPDVRFLCQSSSLKFLSSKNFDFNKLFREGIPYLSQEDEERMTENLKEKHKNWNETKNKNNLVSVPTEHASLVEDVCTRISDFLADKGRKELRLEPYNAFVRKLLYQAVEQKFASKVRMETHTEEGQGWNKVLVVKRLSDPSEMERRKAERQFDEMRELRAAVGFSNVIKLMSKSGKLIIGHNMLLDICHAIHQFFSPLPEDYSEFKEMVHCIFPRLLDTKHLASSPPFDKYISSNFLAALLQTLEAHPFTLRKVDVAESGQGYKPTDEKAHEAGYDAYITGVCFISMYDYLVGLAKAKNEGVEPDSPLLEGYVNKLFLYRCQDIPYIVTSGDDPKASRDHVFHITVPKDWKTHDIVELFSPYGSVVVSWKSDTTAWVALNQRDQVSPVIRALTHSSVYSVLPYAIYQQRLNSECNKGAMAPVVVPGTPPGTLRKRKKASPEPELVPKRKTHSFGESTSFSKRSIDPIPEEQESEGSPSPDRSAKKAKTTPDSGKSHGSAAAAINHSKHFKEPDWN